MSLTTAKTLDKNMRREGVLDLELRNLDLKKLPTIHMQEDCDMEDFKEDVHRLCKSIQFWVFDDNFSSVFQEIDMSHDGKLSLDEVHRWFVRTKLQGCDMNTIRK